MNKAMSRANRLDSRFDAEFAEVGHKVLESRFELEKNGALAVAEYRVHDGLMTFTHTFVPSELRGKGLAERLVKAAMEYARTERLRVVPQCSYVETFLKRHPEFADLRAD